MLTKTRGKRLLRLARKAIESHFGKKLFYSEEKKEFKKEQGVFVTLTKHGELRGCIGFPYPVMPLADAIVEAAKAAASSDPRFPPLGKEELKSIKIEVSVLTVPEEIHATGEEILKEIKIGKDGLIVRMEGFSGLLLPQVAHEFKWNALEFLEATCNKAGLQPNSWMSSQCHIFKFQAQIFSEGKTKSNKTC